MLIKKKIYNYMLSGGWRAFLTNEQKTLCLYCQLQRVTERVNAFFQSMGICFIGERNFENFILEVRNAALSICST